MDVQDYSDSKSIIKHLLEIYRIKWVCVTKGENGSELYRSGVPYAINQPANFPRSIKDTVGAGDAFSAMLASGLLRGLSEHLILERASLFASEICSIKGALPKNMDFYIPFGVEND